MSASVINLNQARKSRARAQATAQADANRLRFGRSKAEKSNDAKIVELANRNLDGSKRGPDARNPDARDPDA